MCVTIGSLFAHIGARLCTQQPPWTPPYRHPPVVREIAALLWLLYAAYIFGDRCAGRWATVIVAVSMLLFALPLKCVTHPTVTNERSIAISRHVLPEGSPFRIANYRPQTCARSASVSALICSTTIARPPADLRAQSRCASPPGCPRHYFCRCECSYSSGWRPRCYRSKRPARHYCR